MFVDTGLLRLGEAEQVEETFRRQFHVDLVHVKAADRFLGALTGVTDPEQKRKIIGETFIRVFEEVARAFARASSCRERSTPTSSSRAVATTPRSSRTTTSAGFPTTCTSISSSRCATCSRTRCAIGEELGLPEEIVWRQPFPGPGLAVRIIGEVTPERLETLRQADAVVLEELRVPGSSGRSGRAFAVLPAVKTVGVMGDGRTYEYPVIVRAVTSEDAMTADWARLPHDLLERIASRIINEVPGVNRVAYDITSKPPGTIEWE